MREATNRGAAIDLSEFERRMRGPEAAKRAADPLSELARIMEGEDAAQADPFGSMFTAPRPVHPEPVSPRRTPKIKEDIFSAELRGTMDHAPSVEPHAHDPYTNYAYDPQVAPHAPVPPQGRPMEPAPEPQWSDDPNAYLDYGPEGEEAGYGAQPEQAEGGRRWLNIRPWHAVAAAALIGAGGIGWSFAHRSGDAGSRDIAIIAAPQGPAKVLPSADAQPKDSDQGATVLDRHETAQVRKIVTHEEQAVDPTVLPKAVQLGDGPVNAPHEPAALARPEPKKVKTVSVRPDGTVIEHDAPPPAVAKAVAPPHAPAARDVALGGTPKSAAKPATTPVAKAPVKPKPALKPAPKVAAAEEPADAAGAADDAAAPVADAPVKGSSGSFAVQFGAASSEAEARALVSMVADRYSGQLGGRKPSFKMATVGEKTVYRVRVAGMSKESATAVCGKVKASGGNCFVAGN
jgi:hypothetical protein